jgi:hypothetical protein
MICITLRLISRMVRLHRLKSGPLVPLVFFLSVFACGVRTYVLPTAFCNHRFPRPFPKSDRISEGSLFLMSMSKISSGHKAIINTEQVQIPILPPDLAIQATETKRATIPSEQEVCSEILSTIQQNPEFGFRRVHQAVRAHRPDWAIRDARVRTLLQKVRLDLSLPAAILPSSGAEIEQSDIYAVQLEALFKRPSPHANTPTMPTDNDDGEEEAEAMDATSSAPASTAPLPAGLHAPPQRDMLIDASRQYRDRFESLLELERSHQASEVMERLRVWPTLRLQREGLAVTGLVANPGPPPPPQRPPTRPRSPPPPPPPLGIT